MNDVVLGVAILVVLCIGCIWLWAGALSVILRSIFRMGARIFWEEYHKSLRGGRK